MLIGDRATADGAMDALRRALAGLGVPANSAIARHKGQAAEIAKAARASGDRYLVAVGGDPLVHELVEALIDPDGKGSREGSGEGSVELVLGLVGLGRQDTAATYGLPEEPEHAARHLLGGTVFTADVGRARWEGLDGEPRSGLFLNSAELGYPAMVSAAAARRRGPSQNRAMAFAAALTALAAGHSTPVHLTLAHTAVDFRLAGLILANGQFSMGRSKVAPRALPDDGRLNVIAFEGEPLAIYSKSARIYYGDHIPDTSVREYQSPEVGVHTAEPMPLALDGVRVAGRTPATFDLLPGALRLKV
jgi:diacylglycerol kinase family enzyme